ncbi:MAG: Response regulator of zinc sigma-54-dependent two-component system [Nitrospira sp.]|jgi:DNA-binding NtrC family response regulator|nr:MAG: Response regulator of zinc sigma-54-dependent two-component system [Nitrospira sp.]
MPSRDSDTILVADDDPVIRRNLRVLMEAEGYRVVEAADGMEAAKALEASSVILVLLDLKMPKCTGLDVLRDHQDRLEDTPVIVITALGGSSAAIEAMKLGAYDYITKPFDLDDVLFTVRRALEQTALVAQVQALTSRDAAADSSPEELVGQSPAMLAVFKTIGKVATTQEPVLILGESGTGKELVANAVHRNSDRAGKPFVKVNCAALSPMLLESEFFGHERGAFTGAVMRRIGRFEQANGGTLFLDEIGDLGLDLQVKILRTLQHGQFERVGGEQTIQVDVRIIAATNRDLPALIAERRFREDLYYRLNVVTIELPPLRSRRGDIPVLAEHIILTLARKYNWPQLAISPDAMQHLSLQSWSGNVRELQNVLARAAILTRGRLIRPEDLKAGRLPSSSSVQTSPSAATFHLRDILAETERRVIQEALSHTTWNRTQAARLLGISRRQLFDKIREYGLARKPEC